jgi:CRISPR-associated protein Cas2
MKINDLYNLFNDTFEDVIDNFSCYRVGHIFEEYNPAKEEYKNMLHLVAYDIREPKRLRNVAKTCEDFGMRVEYSVFECDLAEKHFQQFWQLLADIIDPDEDRILAYRICGSCVTRIESMGTISRPGKPLLYIL